MQHILSEEELQALQNAPKLIEAKYKKTVQELCTLVCDTLPIDWKWERDEPQKPWGCIHSTKHEWYCDQCPVQKLCPSDKHWSK